MSKNKSLDRGRNFEYRVLGYLEKQGYNARRIPMSGVSPAFQGDLQCEDGLFKYLIECKKTAKGSLSIKHEWLKDIDKKASKGDRKPLLVIGFGNSELYVIQKLEQIL